MLDRAAAHDDPANLLTQDNLAELVIGVDTHKHTHTAAVVVAATGAVLDRATVPATPAGYQQLLLLAGRQPGRRVWAIEGTGGYGAKSDPIDAQRQLHALVTAAPETLRGRLPGLSTRELVTACARLRQRADFDAEAAATVASLRALARRIRALDTEAAEHTRAITKLVRAWRPDLLRRRGVGPMVAAILLCAWSHAGRCRSDGAFAMLGGAAPIPASSGQTVRHRLNRSGDRQLNQALHLVVLTRLRTDPATRAYAQRRRAQGKTNREIKRCLVRYVARQLYRLLEAQPAVDAT